MFKSSAGSTIPTPKYLAHTRLTKARAKNGLSERRIHSITGSRISAWSASVTVSAPSKRADSTIGFLTASFFFCFLAFCRIFLNAFASSLVGFGS